MQYLPELVRRTTGSLCGWFVLAALLLFAWGTAAQNELNGQIVFSSDRSGAWRIWMINADGSDLRQITEGDEDAHDVDPMFSADGKTILFSSTRGGGIGVWTVSTEGEELTRICDGDQAEWSPDGSRLALRRENRIWIRDLKSGEEKAVTPEDWPLCSGPAWQPDGKGLAFAARWDAGNGIYLTRADGDEPVKVYDKKGACEPHFTPDGSLIVYETETNICTVQPDGMKNKMITYQAGVQRYGRTSPDGEHIVYCQGVSENGPWELYIVPTKGGYPTKLTEGGSDMNPDWK